MRKLRIDELEPGVSVLFKQYTHSDDWLVDIIGYVSHSLLTLMSNGEYHRNYGFYAYDKLAMAHILVGNETVNQSSLETYEKNLKDCYL